MTAKECVSMIDGRTMVEQYNESLMLLLHRIGELKAQLEAERHGTADFAKLVDRITKLEVMLDDVYIQANGAREYAGLWGKRVNHPNTRI